MTDRMLDDRLDREIRSYLAWQADQLDGAPSGMEMAVRVDARVGSRSRVWSMTPSLRWILLLVLLAVAVASVAIIGSIGRLPVVDGPPQVPANGWIAYSTRDHQASTGVFGEILLVRTGEEPRRLAGGDARITTCPSFSPDGTKLLFLQDGELVVLDGDPVQEMREVGRFDVRDRLPGVCPIWSPVGEIIAMPISDGISLLRLDGTRRAVGTPGIQPVEFAEIPFAWKHDGTTIAIAASTGIVLAGVDETPTEPERVSPVVAQSVSWSPDGSQIAFEADGRAHILPIGIGAPVIELGVGATPLWSPSGDSLAYRGNAGVVVVGRDGSNASVVGADLPGGYGFGGWSPDGKLLLRMLDISGADWNLMAIVVADGTDVVLVDGIDTGSARNFPGFGDVTWQAVYP